MGLEKVRSTRLIGIFEGIEDNHILFSLRPGKKTSSLRVRVDGMPDANIPRTVGWDDRAVRLKASQVGSMAIPKDSHTIEFFEEHDCQVAYFDKKLLYKTAQGRDVAMVNPAIDGLYEEWLAHHPVVPPHLSQKILNQGPTFSFVVPLFHTPSSYFDQMLASLLSQSYTRFEVVLVNASPEDEELCHLLSNIDSEQVRIVTLDKNRGIAQNTNAGIAAATGEYVAFADHDDIVSPYLLAWYAYTISNDSHTDLLYCDEDNFETLDKGFFAPRFKPEPNIDLLCSFNYYVHCLCVSRRVLDLTERSSSLMDGAQDYDLSLKAMDVARSVHRVPKVLYHWRQHPGSTNGGAIEQKPYAIEASIEAIKGYWARKGIDTNVWMTSEPCVFAAEYPKPGSSSLSCVVPCPTVEEAWRFLEESRDWLSRFAEVVFVCPLKEARSKETLSSCETRVRLVACRQSNWTALVDTGCREAVGDLILVCDRSVRFHSAKDLDRLMGYFSRPNLGAVAPRVLLHDGLVGQAVQVITKEGRILPIDQGLSAQGGGGYLGLAQVDAQCSALAPTVFLIQAEEYKKTRGLDRDVSSARYAMADLCFQLRERGLDCISAASISCEALVPIAFPRQPENPSDRRGRRWLWSRWGAQWKKDVLACEGVVYDGGYPHLDIDWIDKTQSNQAVARLKALLRRVSQPNGHNLWFS